MTSDDTILLADSRGDDPTWAGCWQWVDTDKTPHNQVTVILENISIFLIKTFIKKVFYFINWTIIEWTSMVSLVKYKKSLDFLYEWMNEYRNKT